MFLFDHDGRVVVDRDRFDNTLAALAARAVSVAPRYAFTLFYNKTFNLSPMKFNYKRERYQGICVIVNVTVERIQCGAVVDFSLTWQ